MNYKPFEDGRRMVESTDAGPCEMPHNFPKRFGELHDERKHLAGRPSAVALTCEAPLRCLSVLCWFRNSYLDLRMSLPALLCLSWHLCTCCVSSALR